MDADVRTMKNYYLLALEMCFEKSYGVQNGCQLIRMYCTVLDDPSSAYLTRTNPFSPQVTLEAV